MSVNFHLTWGGGGGGRGSGGGRWREGEGTSEKERNGGVNKEGKREKKRTEEERGETKKGKIGESDLGQQICFISPLSHNSSNHQQKNSTGSFEMDTLKTLGAAERDC